MDSERRLGGERGERKKNERTNSEAQRAASGSTAGELQPDLLLLNTLTRCSTVRLSAQVCVCMLGGIILSKAFKEKMQKKL